MVVQDALTVYHAVWDPQTRAGGWERRVIRGVCWQGGRQIAVTSQRSGVRRDDRLTVYTPAAVWPGETPPCVREDRICKGICDQEQPPLEAVAVSRVDRFAMGRPRMHHWRIQ